MSKTAISQYSATPSSNSDVDGIDISEGCPASNLNNAQRSLMSHLKEMDDGTSALTSPSMGQLNVDNLRLDGNTISSTDTNGDITIDPAGTGDTIIASGNVGIGSASPAGANGIALTVNATTNPRFRLTSDNTGTGSGDGSGIFLNNSDMFISNEESAPMIFRTSATERMRIDSAGHILFGRSSVIDSGRAASGTLSIGGAASGTSECLMQLKHGSNTNSTQRNYVLIYNDAGSIVGSITANSSSTAYNTSSDYRLKENVTYDWDATTRLKQLKPARFNFIADPDTTVDGFLAHEAQTVCPESVSGSKDAVEVWKDGEELPDGVSAGDNKLDDDGNTIPLMQGIDQAKIVPLLTKALIESVEKIEQLEARITALEAE